EYCRKSVSGLNAGSAAGKPSPARKGVMTVPGAAHAHDSHAGARPWWETRIAVAVAVVAAAIPLIYPTVPPLVDLLGHMGRYRVELDLGRSPWLHDYYDYHWAAI